MSEAKKFRKIHDRLMSEAKEKVSVIRAEADASLESLATLTFGPAQACADDGFGPPLDAVRVECWHCGDKYSSDEMRWMYRPRMQHAVVDSLGRGFARISPMWWCKNLDCDGGGFGHDIHPVKERKRSKVVAA